MAVGEAPHFSKTFARERPVDLELTEYVLLAFLVLLGVLVRHRLRYRKSQQLPPQQTTQPAQDRGGDQES